MRILFLIIFLLASSVLIAQVGPDCDVGECGCILKKANAIVETGEADKYEQALYLYFAAKACDESLTEIVNERTVALFEEVRRLEGEKEDALTEVENANRALGNRNRELQVALEEAELQTRKAKALYLHNLAMQAITKGELVDALRFMFYANAYDSDNPNWLKSLYTLFFSSAGEKLGKYVEFLMSANIHEFSNDVLPIAVTYSENSKVQILALKNGYYVLIDPISEGVVKLDSLREDEVSEIFDIGSGYLLINSFEEGYCIWNSNGEKEFQLKGGQEGIYYAFPLSEERFVTFSNDSIPFQIWNYQGFCLAKFGSYGLKYLGEVYDKIAFSDDGNGDVVLYDNEGNLVVEIEHNETLGALGLDEARFLTWSNDGSVKIWNLEGREKSAFYLKKEIINIVHFKNQELLIFILEGSVELLDYLGQSVMKFETNDDLPAVNTGEMLGDGQGVVLFGDRGFFVLNNRFYPVGKGQFDYNPFMIGTPIGVNSELLFMLNSKYFFWWNMEWLKSVASKKGYYIIDEWYEALSLGIPYGELLCPVHHQSEEAYISNSLVNNSVLEHDGPVLGGLTLNREKILTWSMDSTARIWSYSGELEERLEHDGPVLGGLTLNREKILTWSMDSTARIWSYSGELEERLEHDGPVLGGLTLNREKILTWSMDSTARIWSYSGELEERLEHDGPVLGGLTLNREKILTWSDRSFTIWESHNTRWISNRFDVDFIIYSGTIITQQASFLLFSKEGQVLIVDFNGKVVARKNFQPDFGYSRLDLASCKTCLFVVNQSGGGTIYDSFGEEIAEFKHTDISFYGGGVFEMEEWGCVVSFDYLGGVNLWPILPSSILSAFDNLNILDFSESEKEQYNIDLDLRTDYHPFPWQRNE